jgi:hypothetical protein
MALEGKKLHIAVAMPASDEVKTFFAYDLARLMAFTASNRPDIELAIIIATGSLVMKQRQTLAANVLKDGTFTHILWLDTDLRFPKDTLIRLLAHDVPVVCASYTERNAPFKPVAFTNPEDWRERAWPTPDSTGLRRIVAAGFGCVLTETAVFEKMPKPWFHVGWNREAETFMGEDIYFFLQLNGLGIPLWLDQDLTKEIAHIGRFEFTPEHALRAEEQRQARAEATPAEATT